MPPLAVPAPPRPPLPLAACAPTRPPLVREASQHLHALPWHCLGVGVTVA